MQVYVGVDPGNKTGLAYLVVAETREVMEVELAEIDLVDGDSWWERCAFTGALVAERIREDTFRLGGDADVYVCIEDYVLSPVKAAGGAGGRDVVSPVGITSVLVWELIEGDVQIMFSMPSAKTAVGSRKLEELLGIAKAGGSSVAGQHRKDALMHAVLGWRMAN